MRLYRAEPPPPRLVVAACLTPKEGALAQYVWGLVTFVHVASRRGLGVFAVVIIIIITIIFIIITHYYYYYHDYYYRSTRRAPSGIFACRTSR